MDRQTMYEKIAALPYHGRLHCHSENSLKDSFNKVGKMAERAKELHYDALALTDHGNVAGWIQFMKACNKAKVRPVLGVEAYVKDILTGDDNTKEEDSNISHVGGKADSKLHLILLGLDDIGRKTVSLIITEANKHIETRGGNVYPCIDKTILEAFLAPGTEGHGHVIVTSACVGGVLAGRVYQNDAYEVELQDITEKLAEDARTSVIYAHCSEELEKAKAMYDRAKMLKGKTYKQALRVVNAREDGPEKEKALKELEHEMAETELAIQNFPFFKTEVQKWAKQAKVNRDKLLNPEVKSRMEARKAYLETQVLSAEDIESMLRNEAMYYDNLAGHGNFYIELQYHRLPMEKLWMPVLNRIAHELGIPTVAANDEHMIYREETEARKYLNAMRYASFRYEAPSESDYELCFKSDEEFADMLTEMLGNPEWTYEAFKGISDIITRCDAGQLANGKHYPKLNSEWTKEEAEAELERRARAGIAARYPDWDSRPELEERLKYELSVIYSMGFTHYFLVVQWYINVGKKLGHVPADRFHYLEEHVLEMNIDEVMAYIEADQSLPGYSVGPGRGSGAGSIVCYLTGITAIDPIRLNLVFERFLNPERVSMPDIDVDFSNHIRDLLIQIMKVKFGIDGVCGIMSRNTLAAKNSIKKVAKVYGSKVRGDGKFFLTLGDEMAAVVSNKPGVTLDESEADIKAKFGDNPDAMEILRIAKALEGTYESTGQHAAGVVIADNGDLRQYMALFYVEGTGWVSQFDKVEVEEYGMLKFDFLGLKTLDIITDTIQKVYARHPEVKMNIDDLPVEPEVMNIFSSGNTLAVFQFESPGMIKVLRGMQPRTFEDLIIPVAMYRPGPLDEIDNLIANKNSGDYHYLFPQLESILKTTYGVITYQEQVQEIFRNLAGYSMGGADNVRRAMSKKHKDELERERKVFLYGDESRGIAGCEKNGYDVAKANQLFEMMLKFAAYAFNKSHAATYAYVAYITAYLKCHYPREFYCTVLEYTELEKIPPVVKECRRNHINVCNPDVNKSQEEISLNGDDIYIGLKKVKGVAGSAAGILEKRREKEFTSVGDFLMRTGCKKDVFKNLISAGAFDSLFDNRDYLYSSADILLDSAANLDKAMRALDDKLAIVKLYENGDVEGAAALNGGKRINFKIIARSVKKVEGDIANYKEALILPSIPPTGGNAELIRKETDVLGVALSASYLDGYKPVASVANRRNKWLELKSLSLDDADDAYQKSELALNATQDSTEQNIIRSNAPDVYHKNDVRSMKVRMLIFFHDSILRQSKNGNMFAKAVGETSLGTIPVLCFDKECQNQLVTCDGPVVACGTIKDGRNGGDATFFVERLEDAVLDITPIQIRVKNVGAWLDIADMQKLSREQNPEKVPRFRIVQWLDESMNEIRTSSLDISDATYAYIRECENAAVVEDQMFV